MRILIQLILCIPCFLGAVFVACIFGKIALDSILEGTSFDANEWLPGIAALYGAVSLMISIIIPDDFGMRLAPRILLMLGLSCGVALAVFTVAEGLIANRSTGTFLWVSLLLSSVFVAVWNVQRLQLYKIKKEPNKAVEPTIMAVTDAAAQPPRQP